MKKVIGFLSLLIITVGCAPNQIETPVVVLSPIPPSPTTTLTSTATLTPTPYPTPSLTSTFTSTPSPYNLSFEYDDNWAFEQRWNNFFAEYSTNWKSDGGRSLKLFYKNTSSVTCEINVWDRVEVSGEVDLTNADYIVYDVMPLNPEYWERWHRSRRKLYPLGLEIYIDNNYVSVLSEVTQELIDQFVPIKNLTGMHTLKFVFHPLQPRLCSPGEFGIYLDNVRALSSDQFLSSLASMPTPFPTSADVQADTLLFSEDFEDEQVSGWTTGQIIAGDRWYGNSWDIRQDASGNHFWQGAGDVQWPQVWYLPQNWTDYAFEVRFRDVSPKQDSGILICIRTSKDGDFYIANIGTNGSYQLARYNDGEYKMLKGADRAFLKHQWYLARLEAQGDEIRLFVDDQLLMTVNDSTLSSGSIGFYMSGGSYIHLDDLRVWSLPPGIQPSSQRNPSTSTPVSVRSVQVNLEANLKWKDMGILVKEGDRLQLSHISGIWRSSPDYSWSDGFQCDGTCADCLLPTAPEGSLIARIGNGDAFCVASSSIVSKISGNLFLSFNDCVADHCFSDNEGSLSLLVEVSPSP